MDYANALIKEILLIDDDLDEFSLFADALKEVAPTIKLSFANDCFSALSILEGCNPDLIFLDINMPKVSGFGFLSEIKKRANLCNVPVVAYSGSSYTKDIAKSGELGAVLYLVKPTNFQELAASLKDVLGMSWFQPEKPEYKIYDQRQFASVDLNKG